MKILEKILNFIIFSIDEEVLLRILFCCAVLAAVLSCTLAIVGIKCILTIMH